MNMFLPLAVIAVLAILSKAIHILKEYERGVILRLGKFSSVKGPGIILIIPFVDQLHKMNLQTIATDVPPQDVITRDNVSIKVNAVIYFRVIDPERAFIQVEDFLYASLQLAQTTLRSIVGQSELDEILAERDKINATLQEIIDRQTDAWGVKVSMVELKHIDLPQEMQRAMARQAEAERDRRAKVINAQGEYEAAAKLSEAAEIIAKYPVTIQLRYLQTLTHVGADKNSTIVFPFPMDMAKTFMDMIEKK